MRDVPFGHGNRRIERTVIRRKIKGRRRHVALDGLAEITDARSHDMTQITQGENAQRRLVCIHRNDAADLLLVHQLHRFTQWRVGAAGDRVTHRQFAQSGVQRVLRAEGFHGFLLHLLIDLIEQTAYPAQGEIAKGVGEGEQFDERQFVQLQAESVFARKVLGARRAFAEQCGQRKTFAGGDFKRGLGAGLGDVLTFADHPTLLDDIEVFNRAVGGFDDAFALAVETQLTLLHQISQVGVFHLIEGREALEELQGALNVLQYRGFPCLGEGVRFTHNHYRSLFRIVVVGSFWPWSTPAGGVPIGRKSRFAMPFGTFGKCPTKTVGNSPASLLEKNPTKCTLKLCLAMSDDCAR
ncbi:hypothetical protein D3C87_1233890 [compost metagenome]